jgi:hypothetical protein
MRIDWILSTTSTYRNSQNLELYLHKALKKLNAGGGEKVDDHMGLTQHDELAATQESRFKIKT